jgi:hypothetical protein
MSYDELDGRDAIVRKAYKNRKDMVTVVAKPDKVLEGYTEPWAPAFYSRFDDLKPVREADWDVYVDGIPGAKIWHLPVTEVHHHGDKASWFDQMDVGTVVIRQIPNDKGTMDYVISLIEPD